MDINKRIRKIFKKSDAEIPDDGLLEEIVEDLKYEHLSDEELEADRKRVARKKVIKIALVLIVLLAIVLSIFYFIDTTTYKKVNVEASVKLSDSGNSNIGYDYFYSEIIRYSREGISLIDKNGDEDWNQAYSMNNPTFEKSKTFAIVYDKSGTKVELLDKNGLVKEYNTKNSIAKAKVNEAGYVVTLEKVTDGFQIICYNTMGDVLASLTPDMQEIGYPIDGALSVDKETLVVSYMYVDNGTISSKVKYYNFGKLGDSKVNNEVFSKNYKGLLIGEVTFVSNKRVLLLGDKRFIINSGVKTIKEVANVKIPLNIKSEAVDGNNIVLLLKNKDKSGYRLNIYNRKGSLVHSRDIVRDYENFDLVDGKVLLYQDKDFYVLSTSGYVKFNGSLPDATKCIYPVFGVNKYISVTNEGIEQLLLTK
ncbi:MAG: DUF5711 family protein [Lachnospiraceae bacterium]|jgi:hypothetical protein|nr:DUF5711 family protein [Lachnospiraceae bacterium]